MTMAAPLTLDLQSPEYLDDPYPILARLRREAPVFRDAAKKMVFLAKYDDIIWISRERDSRFTHERTIDDVPKILRTNPSREFLERDLRYQIGVAGDPPDHTRRRRSIAKVFTPGTTQREQDPHIRTIAAKLADRMAKEIAVGEVFEFNEWFSGPLPTLVIGRILGLEEDTLDELHHLTVVSVGGGSDMSISESTLNAADDALRAALNDAYDRRLRNPNDEDLISHLIRCTQTGELSEAEARQIVWHVFIGGNETTTNWFNNAAVALLQHPDEYRKVLDDRSLIPNFSEEALRWKTPVPSTEKKAAREDMEIRGVAIEKGDRIWQLLASGNRDEDHFEDPDRFDVTRKNAEEHLSFGGGGPHLCIGWPLARIEAQVGWDVLLDRMPNLELVMDGSTRTGGAGIRGWTQLYLKRLS